MKMAVAPLVELSDGNKMPVLGLGTWESQPCDIKEAVKHAIKVEGGESGTKKLVILIVYFKEVFYQGPQW